MEMITVSVEIPRYTVEQDDSPECPLDWGWGGEFSLVSSGYHSELSQYNTFDPNDENEIPEGITTTLIRGYSQSDWWEIMHDDNVPVDALKEWLLGDIYIVTDNLTGESISGIYAEDENQAINYFKENF